MKTKLLNLLFILFLLSHCGEATTLGGTETGTTDPGSVNISELANRVDTVASSLVPDIKASASISSTVATQALMYRGLTTASSDNWSTYLEDNNSIVLTDIFGDPDETPQVVTKIRVLVDNFKGMISDIVASDSDFSCTDGTALTYSSTIDVAFYGSLDNGSEDNPNFDCIGTTGSNETVIYGQDASGVVRVVAMSDTTSTNTEQTATRGDNVKNMQVIYATYAETTNATDATSQNAFLDLQYNQATLYSGVDNSYDTNDDISFKSRSRITGKAVLNAEGSITSSVGDFTVTKYDQVLNESGGNTEIVTKALGRGDFGANGYSLFQINSSYDALASIAGTFCIQQSADGTSLPSYADETNCADYETATPWTDTTFPFTISPEVPANFDDKELFEGNSTDLISNDGSNFTIPSFE